MNHKRLFIVPLILSFFLTGCLAPQVEDNTNANTNNNTQQNGNDNQNGGETNNNDTNGSETGNESGNDNGTTGTGDNNGQGNTGGDNNQGGTGNESGNTGNGNTGGDTGNTGNTGGDNGQGNSEGNSGNTGGDSGNTGTGGDSGNTSTGGDNGQGTENTNTGNTTTNNPVTTEGDGTQAHPYTVSQAYAIIDALQKGKNNGKVVYVIGTVTFETANIYHGKHGSNFYITDGTNTIYAYSIAGVSKTEGDPKYVDDGYTVVVSGALIKYSSNSTVNYEVGYASSSLLSSLVSSTPGTSSGSSGSGTSTQTPKEKATWTVMIYMCGADLESDSKQGGYASDDIKEILSVSNQPDDVNIIIETGGAKKWYGDLGIKATELGRWHVENKQLVKDGAVAKANMGLQSTFESFLTWGLTYYPADRVGLIMWNHGGGLDGCCFDENYDNDSLTNAEVNAALTNVKTSLNRTENFEFIAYDACLMAIQDIAEYNSHHFNYMLSSQESESGCGYDYDQWVDDLYANPTTITTQALLTEAGQTFLDEERTLYQGWNEPFDQTQSVYDLSKIAAYKTAYEAVATELAKTVTNSTQWNSFVSANINASSVQKYGVDEDGNYLFDIFDAEDVLNNIKTSYSSLSTKVDAALAALDDVVVWEAHGEATSGCGMNIYCPVNYKYYEEDTSFANWYNLCKLSGLYKDK